MNLMNLRAWPGAGEILSVRPGSVEHSFERGGGAVQADVTGSDELDRIGEVELVEELSLLTTQAARMRARMADIVAELDRRRQCRAKPAAAGSHAASSW